MYIVAYPIRKAILNYKNLHFNPSHAEYDMHYLGKQCRSKEANWSGSALFVIKYVNFYQKRGSSNLIGFKLEKGVAS